MEEIKNDEQLELEETKNKVSPQQGSLNLGLLYEQIASTKCSKSGKEFKFICTDKSCQDRGVFSQQFQEQHKLHKEKIILLEQLKEVHVPKQSEKKQKMKLQKIERIKNQMKLSQTSLEKLRDSITKTLQKLEDQLEKRGEDVEDKLNEIQEQQCDVEQNMRSITQREGEIHDYEVNDLVNSLNLKVYPIDQKIKVSKSSKAQTLSKNLLNLEIYATECLQTVNQSITLIPQEIETQLASFQSLRSGEYLRLLKQNYHSQEIYRLMLEIDRADFVPRPQNINGLFMGAYQDSAQQIGFQTTISAPHMHCLTLQLMKENCQQAQQCLDIGTGSGFIAVAMAKLMTATDGVSYGLDHIKGIIRIAKNNISKNHEYLLNSGRIQLCLGDGRQGLPEYAPFDVIHLGAAATIESITKFIDQLNPGGILIGPLITSNIGGGQQFTILKQTLDGKIEKQKITDVLYGKLVSKAQQLKGTESDKEISSEQDDEDEGDESEQEQEENSQQNKIENALALMNEQDGDLDNFEDDSDQEFDDNNNF